MEDDSRHRPGRRNSDDPDFLHDSGPHDTDDIDDLSPPDDLVSHPLLGSFLAKKPRERDAGLEQDPEPVPEPPQPVDLTDAWERRDQPGPSRHPARSEDRRAGREPDPRDRPARRHAIYAETEPTPRARSRDSLIEPEPEETTPSREHAPFPDIDPVESASDQDTERNTTIGEDLILAGKLLNRLDPGFIRNAARLWDEHESMTRKLQAAKRLIKSERAEWQDRAQDWTRLRDKLSALQEENRHFRAEARTLEEQVKSKEEHLSALNDQLLELENKIRTLQRKPRKDLLRKVRRAFAHDRLEQILTEITDDAMLETLGNTLLYCLPDPSSGNEAAGRNDPLRKADVLNALGRQFLARIEDLDFAGRSELLKIVAEHLSDLSGTHTFRSVEDQAFSSGLHQTLDGRSPHSPGHKIARMLTFLIVREKTVWSKATVVLEEP